MENNNNNNQKKTFKEVLIEHINEIENKETLDEYLTKNINVILRIIKKYPRTKKKMEEKVLENGVEMLDTAYKTLTTHIQKKFPEYKITPKMLSSRLTKIKKNLGMEIRKTKRNKEK